MYKRSLRVRMLLRTNWLLIEQGRGEGMGERCYRKTKSLVVSWGACDGPWHIYPVEMNPWKGTLVGTQVPEEQGRHYCGIRCLPHLSWRISPLTECCVFKLEVRLGGEMGWGGPLFSLSLVLAFPHSLPSSRPPFLSLSKCLVFNTECSFGQWVYFGEMSICCFFSSSSG